MLRFSLTLSAFSLLTALIPATHAENAADRGSQVSEVIVTDRREARSLNEPTQTTNRLGLTIRETPATLDVIGQDAIQALGLRTATEAYNSAPGVRAGDIPGALGSASMRGFGSGGVSYLLDGVRITNSAVASRAWDTWNFDRIEVLKGPSSVLYGEGVLAGAINLIPRKPELDAQRIDAMISTGSFDTLRAGVGANIPIDERLAVRGDISYSRSSGYIDDTGMQSAAATTALVFKPDDRLTLEVALDYFYDDYSTAYFGVPLVPAALAREPLDVVSHSDGLVVDEAMRYRNYDVSDGLMDSRSYWLRTRLLYPLSDSWRFTNELSVYDGDRRWANAEDYTFNADTGLLDRATTLIFHDQQFWTERAFVSFDGEPGQRRNRFSVGVEYSDTDFGTNRRFGTTTPVDPYAPERGVFPTNDAVSFPGAGNRVDFESQVAVRALFMEEAFNVTPQWLLVAGARYDDIELDRTVLDLNVDTATSFGRNYNPVSWRVGSVFDVNPRVQVYSQYSYAVTPVGSLLLMNQNNARFDLTTGDSIEIGIKSSFADERIALTVAAYRIEQADILTRDPADPRLTLQGGRQTAEGFELSAAATVTEHFRVDGSLALLTSQFDELMEAGGVDRAGNRPANVPEQTATLNAYYGLSRLPVTLGAAIQHAGSFFTSNANTVRVDGHTTLSAWASYDLSFGRFTVRARNLTDEIYADWSGFSATQVYLAAPRSVDLTFTTRF